VAGQLSGGRGQAVDDLVDLAEQQVAAAESDIVA